MKNSNELIDIYESTHLFVRKSIEEQNTLFYNKHIHTKKDVPSIVPREEFERRLLEDFPIINAFKNYIPLGKIVIAGGSVLRNLLADNETYASRSNEYDLDIFIRDTLGVPIMDSFMCNMFKNTRDKTLRVITKNAITYCSGYPHRNVQLVTNRVYNNTFHILETFDIDCCAVAVELCVVNGNIRMKPVAHPRAIAAINSRRLFIDDMTISPTSFHRIYKYLHRGFALTLPAWYKMPSEIQMIDDTVYDPKENTMENTMENLINRLIVTAAFYKLGYINLAIGCHCQTDGVGGCNIHHNGSFNTIIKKNSFSIIDIEASMLETMTQNTDPFVDLSPKTCGSDLSNLYNGVFIPYGPEWTIYRIKDILENMNTTTTSFI